MANDAGGVGEIVEQWHVPDVSPLTSHLDLNPALNKLCLEAARQFRSVVLDESTFASDPPSPEILEALDRINVRSYAGTPMWAGTELVGWVSLHQVSEPRVWSPHTLALAEALAHDVAIALLQSQAYQGQSEAVARPTASTARLITRLGSRSRRSSRPISLSSCWSAARCCSSAWASLSSWTVSYKRAVACSPSCSARARARRSRSS
jgi:GAF domain-containing protein